jgi:MFS superfamily sulfate permease-like transporter
LGQIFQNSTIYFPQPRVEKKLRYPVPIELLCMVAATLASATFNLGTEFGVKCLGHIPTGYILSEKLFAQKWLNIVILFCRLPELGLPPMWLVPKILFQSLPIALVGFTITFSMASILAKKGNYHIRANQEAAALVINCLYKLA